jgi:hypothetical protein
MDSVRGLPIHFHSSLLPLAFPSTPEPFRSFGVLSGVSGILGDHLKFLNSTLSPLDSPHPTSRHTTVQSLLMLILCTCFPAFLARSPQSILFGSSFARSVVYYSLCIILSYIFSLDHPLLAWVISLRTARLPLQIHVSSQAYESVYNEYLCWILRLFWQVFINLAGIPWNDITESPSEHMSKRSQPDSNHRLEEPSHIKSVSVNVWLQHWLKLQKKRNVH